MLCGWDLSLSLDGSSHFGLGGGGGGHVGGPVDGLHEGSGAVYGARES